VKLHFETHGEGTPILVFTHGLAASNSTWRAQVEGLAEQFRIVSVDLRGHGESDSPPGPYSLPDLAEDLRQVADDIGAERIVPVGHSAGGAIALQFALDFPNRAAALVLVGTASECNDRSADFYHRLASMAEEQGMEPVLKRLGLAKEAATLAPANPAGFASAARAMATLRESPLTPRLAEVACPTLILVGEKDFLGAGGSVIMSRKIPNAQLEIIPERGHGLFLEDPEGFNRRVRDFVRSVNGN
jgi:3-oxoadipate enol-lactonase